MARNKFRNGIFIAGILLCLVIVAAAIIMVGRSSSDTADPAEADAGTAAQASAPQTGLAQSSDKVRLAVADAGQADALASDEIVLTLNMDAGWHVNANPASMEFLIPTAASASADGRSLDIPVQYPPGRVSDITLGDTAIEVYDDGARIRLLPGEKDAAMLQETGELDVKVRVQACNDSGVCLAPSDLSVTLDPAAAAGR